MEISQMTVSDLEEIKDTLYADFDDFWTYTCFLEELKNPNSTYFVAKSGTQIVGFAGIWQAVDDIHITNIVVKKDFRQKGIGSKLLEKLIETAASKKVVSLTLEVNCHNQSAINLYKKYNFTHLGTRKKYYNSTDDAYIMTLFF